MFGARESVGDATWEILWNNIWGNPLAREGLLDMRSSEMSPARLREPLRQVSFSLAFREPGGGAQLNGNECVEGVQLNGDHGVIWEPRLSNL